LFLTFIFGLFKKVFSYSYKTNNELGTAYQGVALLNLKHYSDGC